MELQHGLTYYNTIRAVNGAGHVIESDADGITVDQTPPRITIEDISGVENEVSINIQIKIICIIQRKDFSRDVVGKFHWQYRSFAKTTDNKNIMST